ncbi:MAG: DUF1801 domain-containing protein [Armatimonadetes bacterium]|nr:DUF1801 domain-containing protein [Armatimonadota bacterium]
MAKAATASTPARYIAQLDEPRRSEIKELDARIRKAFPALKPHVQSGMIGYGKYRYRYASGREGESSPIGLSSRAQYISVYVMGAVDGKYFAERAKKHLPTANIGKCCIRFKKLEDVDWKVLARVMREGVRALKADKTTVSVEESR